jgi:hypothetical protein
MKISFRNLINTIKKNKREFGFICGVFLLIFGTLLYFLFPFILGFILNLNFKIKEGNLLFENWYKILF